MTVVTFLIVLLIVESIVEAIAWGTGGYLLFRLFAVRQKHWYLECLLIFAVFVAWQYVCSLYLLELDLAIGNQEVFEFFGDDLSSYLEFGYLDVIYGVIEILVGYFAGRLILTRLQKRGSVR